ncbi:MAG: hypothetical protein WAT79_14835 [Saprospiraceae bacterium]
MLGLLPLKTLSQYSILPWMIRCKVRNVVLIFLLLIGFNHIVFTQKVIVSNDINIRTNYAYDIFPDVKGRNIFYHDRGDQHVFEIYDEDLKFITTNQIEIPYKQAKVVGMTKTDSLVHVYFQWKESNQSYISAFAINHKAEPIDSANVIYTQEFMYSPSIRYAHSEDKSLVVLFWVESRFFNYLVIKNDMSYDVIDSGKIDSKEFNFKSDFVGLSLSNDAMIYLVGQKSRSWTKNSDNQLMVMSIQNSQYAIRHFMCSEYDISQAKGQYDNVNQQFILSGLLLKNNEDACVGYFVHRLSENDDSFSVQINPQTFNMEFISEVYGKKSNKIKKIDDVYLDKMVVRRDGGVILLMEIKKEFLRRAGSSAMSRFGDVYNGRGFVDYYNEDIILVSNNPDGSEHWKKVLYKKQFSQDDNAIYSSYFLFITPSRMKIIYNDEIKTNNTVSEYVVDPFGTFERKSLLSTQYQNLKLRFRDAIQVSSGAFIVPSESSHKINLVKIEYP